MPLPDGRVAWLFSDTYLGAVNPDHSRPANAPMVNNTLVVQSGNTLGPTLHGGTAAAPSALVAAPANELYWVGDGTVTGGSLKAFYNRYQRTGSGILDIRLAGTSLVTFALPALTVASVQPLPVGDTIGWGSAIVEEGAYTYVYGTESTSDTKFAHLARVASTLTGAWEFWTGSGWSTTEADSARLLSGVGTAFSVDHVGDSYVLVTHDTDIGFGSSVVAHVAAAPQGPFDAPRYLFDAPEPRTPGHYVYDARTHPELASNGKLLISYNVNSFREADLTEDVRVYRPRFVEVGWPLAQPDPTTLPGKPTGLAIDGTGSPIRLCWTAPTGGATGYRVYRRDVTAGQTHFTRLPGTVTETSYEDPLLADGHTYEFRVTAVNSVGEGQPSGTATVAIRVTPPPAPTSPTASANGAGEITVTWTGVNVPARYSLYLRDVTAGQTEFAQVLLDSPLATTGTARKLANGHTYEFVVTAVNGGGESARSTPVQATARYDLPAAPTGLRATADNAGAVQLDWTPMGSDIWYWVYQRDVTGGETAFRRLDYPVTQGASAKPGGLIDGHVYEFKVSGVSGAGEGPASATIQVTSVGGVPLPPSGHTATAGDGKVALSWTASPSANVLYWIYYREAFTAGGFRRLEYPASGTTATVSPLTNGRQYEFQVAATNASGDSPPTATVSARPLPPIPAAPTGLTAIAGDGEVGLGWQMTPGAELYNVYYRDATAGQNGWTKLPLPIREWWLTVRPLANGHRYEFQVSAVNAAGEGARSAVVASTPVPPAPQAPSGLSAVAGDGRVSLSWNARSTSNVYYWVYYRPQGHSGWYYYQYPTLATSFKAPAMNGFTYEFRVTAANVAGQSGFSNTVSAKPVPPPPVPPTISASSSPGRVVLSWSCTLMPGLTGLWIEENRDNSGWRRLPNPVWHNVGLCDQGYSIDTSWYPSGQFLQYRVVAERSGVSSVSNVAAINVRATHAQVYLSFTEPTAEAQRLFFQAKNSSGNYADYGFDWSNDGCSNSPDEPFGWPFVGGCIRHDFGYGNNRKAGMSTEPYRYRIDYTLLSDLNLVCSRVSSHQSDCYALASVYYNVVREFGRDAWDS